MEKDVARQYSYSRSPRLDTRDTQGSTQFEHGWNIVELDAYRQLRLKIQELIRLTHDTTCSRSDMQAHLLSSITTFGSRLASQLVRALHHSDPQERQSVVWLLTILNDPATISPLTQMSRNTRLPRTVRLSASLALAGMGVTAASLDAQHARPRLYAIS